MANWFEQGYEGIGREEQRLATLSGPQRLWMPAGSKKELVFVDDEPIAIYEHNAKINGSWKNWFTCLKGIEDECPACMTLGENTRYYVGYYTAVDTSEWVDRRGNKHQYEMVLIPAKLKSLKKLRRKGADRVEAGGTGLRGCLYRTVRDDDKDPVIGGEFEYVREVDLEKLFAITLYKGKKIAEMWDKATANPEALAVLQKIFKVELDDDKKPIRKLVPFHYFEVLQPLPVRELKAALQGASTGDDDKGTPGAHTDNVPF